MAFKMKKPNPKGSPTKQMVMFPGGFNFMSTFNQPVEEKQIGEDWGKKKVTKSDIEKSIKDDKKISEYLEGKKDANIT